jgi:hypothetical protein
MVVVAFTVIAFTWLEPRVAAERNKSSGLEENGETAPRFNFQAEGEQNFSPSFQ